MLRYFICYKKAWTSIAFINILNCDWAFLKNYEFLAKISSSMGFKHHG